MLGPLGALGRRGQNTLENASFSFKFFGYLLSSHSLLTLFQTVLRGSDLGMAWLLSGSASPYSAVSMIKEFALSSDWDLSILEPGRWGQEAKSWIAVTLTC